MRHQQPQTMIRLLLLLLLAACFAGCSNTAKWADGDPVADYKTRADPAFRKGYTQSRSDAAKAEYWEQARREEIVAGGRESAGGRQVYITLPGPAETSDGVKLHPSEITVPIIE